MARPKSFGGDGENAAERIASYRRNASQMKRLGVTARDSKSAYLKIAAFWESLADELASDRLRPEYRDIRHEVSRRRDAAIGGDVSYQTVMHRTVHAMPEKFW